MSENFDQMFTELIRHTQQAVDGLGMDAEQLEQAPEVEGTAYDERIRVTMKAGRVTRVEIQPPARQLGMEELSDQLVEAINAAIDANLAAMTRELPDQPDFASLNKQLQELQGESIRQLNKYTEGMEQMLRRAKEMGPK